jgi:hypothetical protein
MTGATGRWVRSLSDLLAATGCEDIDGLSAVVDADCEPDVWVVELDAGVEVGSGTTGIGLEFPFPLADFWALVDEVEREEAERIEASAPAGDDAE